jgi:hypothetical protein
MNKPGYRLVEVAVECSWSTPGVHCHHWGDCFHVHYKVWLPVALKSKNVDDWLFRHEIPDAGEEDRVNSL